MIRPSKAALWLAATVVLAAALWLALRPGAEDPTLVLDTADASLEHAHGLDVDPRTGQLYVATHGGLLRLNDRGDLRRVGESYQDVMGFTSTASGSFLASGHPDVAGIRRGDPGHLGLLESRDRGRTWRSLSLSGEADLHAIEEHEGVIFAWDAKTGRFMVSRDGRTWDVRSTLELSSFAADPTNPDRLLASGPSGLLLSADGARSWRPVDGPLASLVGWTRDLGLWAVDSDGRTFATADPERAWESRARLPGEPQALRVTGQDVFAVAASPDGAGLFTLDLEAGRWAAIPSGGG